MENQIDGEAEIDKLLMMHMSRNHHSQGSTDLGEQVEQEGMGGERNRRKGSNENVDMKN